MYKQTNSGVAYKGETNSAQEMNDSNTGGSA